MLWGCSIQHRAQVKKDAHVSLTPPPPTSLTTHSQAS